MGEIIELAWEDPEKRLVRRATLRDLDRIKLLEDATFRLDRLSRRSIKRAIQSPTQAVLTITAHAGEIVGAAVLHYRQRSFQCRLYSIAVSAKQSRQGLGGRLLTACEVDAWQRLCTALKLEVRADNGAAIRFYRNNGYQPVGVKKGFYEDGCNALVLDKKLIKTSAL